MIYDQNYTFHGLVSRSNGGMPPLLHQVAAHILASNSNLDPSKAAMMAFDLMEAVERIGAERALIRDEARKAAERKAREDEAARHKAADAADKEGSNFLTKALDEAEPEKVRLRGLIGEKEAELGVFKRKHRKAVSLLMSYPEVAKIEKERKALSEEIEKLSRGVTTAALEKKRELYEQNCRAVNVEPDRRFTTIH